MSDSPLTVADAVGFAGRWLTFGGILVAVGSVVFRVAVIDRSPVASGVATRLRERAARVGRGAASVVLPAAVARLYFQVDAMRLPGDPWLLLAVKLVAHSAWGYLWLAQVALAFALAVTQGHAARHASSAVGRRAVLVAIGLAATPSFSSHAMSGHASRVVTVAADLLHVVAAGAWLGTLVVMLSTAATWSESRHPVDADRATVVTMLLARFSPLALAGASSLAVSGVVSSYAHFDAASELAESTYGRLLLAKVASVLLVGAVGWRNWRRVTPRLAALGTDTLRRSITTEVAFAAIVLALTSALVITPPPMHG